MEKTEDSNYKFVEWVCRNNHSFTIMEEPELLSLLNFAPLSRKILVENYLPKVFVGYKVKVSSIIENQQFSITSDGWSTNNLKAFYANSITCHFVDKDWVLKHVVLDVSELGGRHTSENIVEHWTKKILDWNLNRNNIIGMNVDGAADYAKAARTSRSKETSVWCCCHRIHLITHKIISNSATCTLFDKCKDVCSLWNASINFQREF